MATTNHIGKPLQLVSWTEKTKKKGQWFEDTAAYFITQSRFSGKNNTSVGEDLKTLYDVYNSQFPESWFKLHTDPLNATEEKHKAFPAKIRPVCFLRTNIDLLAAEYPRRPFIYQVNNLSDSSYSTYQEELKAQVNSNLVAHFQLKLTQELIASGLMTQDGKPVSEEAAQEIDARMQELELPTSIKEKFSGSYKDSQAIKGQGLLRRMLAEEFVKQKLNIAIKHWLIAGETYSFKTVEFDRFKYKVISPLAIDYDKSPNETFIEDGEWVIYEEWLTVSDVVDEYYEELSKENLDKLEHTTIYHSPTNLANHLNSFGDTSGKIQVLHIVWKGKKKVGKLTFINPETQQVEEIEVDEDYPVDKETEKVEWFYANEIYEATKVADFYVRKRAFPFQRSTMNNLSKTKLPYNGRKFSDLHSANISVLKLGIPLQIMYIIITYILEKTIAKSKGKIALIDINSIPRNNGWNEEKFFYYAEASGWAIVNRDQIGVDKSFNQYQVLDLTLFDSIKQLIELQQHFKQEWDDLLGINRQRKGQSYATDTVGNNERATFQSTIITDNIFNMFEEFVEKELQGILDLSKFVAIDGVYRIWNETDLSTSLLEIDPVEYCSSDLGIIVESSSQAIDLKNKLEGTIQAMLQNATKPSTIVSILKSQNIAELESKLRLIEEEQSKMEQANATSEQESAEAAAERAREFEAYLETLKQETINLEYDRKEDIEHIRGTYATFTFQDGDANDNSIPDATEIAKLTLQREKLAKELTDKKEQRINDNANKERDRQLKMEEMRSKERIAKSKPKPKN